MLTPTPRFHVHALALAAVALVLLVVPTIKIHAPLIWALAIATAAGSLIYSIASFFEGGSHILTKMFAGVAIVAALIAAGLAYTNLTGFETF